MLDNLLSLGQFLNPKENSATLKMVSHDRMGGSVPVWEKNNSAKQTIETTFEQALELNNNTTDSEFRLSLAPENSTKKTLNETPFGFGDLIDMVNPFHHLPVISSFYRNMTGDEIRGPGRIIGGTLFGGPLGGASAMINMLVEYDTGRDITEHAMDNILGRDIKTEEANKYSKASSTYEKTLEYSQPN